MKLKFKECLNTARAARVPLLGVMSLLTGVVFESQSRAEGPFEIQLDKGTIVLIPSSSESEVKVLVRKKQNCSAEVKSLESEGKLTIQHLGGFCPSGAEVEVTLPLTQSYRVNHGGGVMILRKTKFVSEFFRQILATNVGGLIQSGSFGFRTESPYANTRAVKDNSLSRSENTLGLHLLGGVIQFE